MLPTAAIIYSKVFLPELQKKGIQILQSLKLKEHFIRDVISGHKQESCLCKLKAILHKMYRNSAELTLRLVTLHPLTVYFLALKQ